MRFVMVHYDFGVYLGNCMGLGFFSMLDTAGQSTAVTFDTVDEIKAHVNSWEVSPEGLPFDQSKIWFVPVETDANYASIADLKKAGLSHMLGDMEVDALRYAEPAGRA